MAIDDAALRALAGVRVGPVSFEEEGGTIIGELGGGKVTLAIEGETLRVETTDRVSWPKGPAFGTGSIDAMLGRIALSRPELILVTGDPAGALTTTAWVDAESSDRLGVATAVKNVLYTAASARDLIESLGAASVAAEIPPVEEGGGRSADSSDIPPPPPSS